MIDKLIEGAFGLAGEIADAIAEKTGADRAVSKEVAIATARAWVARMKVDVTAARERAKRRIRGR